MASTVLIHFARTCVPGTTAPVGETAEDWMPADLQAVYRSSAPGTGGTPAVAHAPLTAAASVESGPTGLRSGRLFRRL